MKNKRFILSITMSNFMQYGGGTNKAVIMHQRIYDSAGISYVTISPVLINGIKNDFSDGFWSVIIDNKMKGVMETNRLINYLNNLKARMIEIDIHHFKNVYLLSLSILIREFNAPIKMFIHDYYTVCTNFTLLKNDEEYCGNKKYSYEKCNNCKYFNESKKNIEMINEFFEEFYERINFFFPSEIASLVWTLSYKEYKSKIHILPHQLLEGKYEENFELLKSDSKIKIAFIGSKEFYKGWPICERIFKKINALNFNYELFYFGTSKGNEDYIKNIDVDFHENDNAMIDALRKYKIDCVILWSLCKETYSYTFYESLASNTFVITNNVSGNIYEQVKKRKCGIILKNEEELERLLINNELTSFINNFRSEKRYGPLRLIDNKDLLNYVNMEFVANGGDNCKLSPNRALVVSIKQIIFSILEQIFVNLSLMKKRIRKLLTIIGSGKNENL